MRVEKESPSGKDGRDTWILEDLSRSGLTTENFNIEPLTCEAELWERLGQAGGTQIINVGGYWIPYPNIPGYYRLKLRESIQMNSGMAKYLSPKGSANHPYILPSVEKLITTYSPDKALLITEGEKKAAKATREDFPCVGLSGVWNWKDSEHDLLPDLKKFIWKDRTVYIVFDSDVIEKHGVRHAELRLAIELANRGAKVFSIRLPNESSGKKNGIDDFLVRHGAVEFAELVKVAKPTLELHVAEGTDSNLIFKEISQIDNEIMRAKIFKLIAKCEGVNMDVVQAEYRKHAQKKEPETKAIGEIFTDVEMTQARELLKSPDILSSMLNLTKK